MNGRKLIEQKHRWNGHGGAESQLVTAIVELRDAFDKAYKHLPDAQTEDVWWCYEDARSTLTSRCRGTSASKRYTAVLQLLSEAVDGEAKLATQEVC